MLCPYWGLEEWVGDRPAVEIVGAQHAVPLLGVGGVSRRSTGVRDRRGTACCAHTGGGGRGSEIDRR